MAMVVKNNMSAVRTLNTLNNNSNALQGSLAKVSSGMKINSAQDDASGYAISERMRVQIRSLDQANQNTQNGSSLMKTAEGAVSKTVEILKSLKEKAISAATDTNTDSDRVTIQKEIDQFIDQIDDNALVTFNGKYLVDGSKTQSGVATKTAMTNQSLFTGTGSGTELTALKNRNGESLEITSTDYLTASFVKDGTTFTTKFRVAESDNTTVNTLNDVFDKLNKQYQIDMGNTDASVFGAANIKLSTEEAAAAADAAFAVITDASVADLQAVATATSDTDVSTLNQDLVKALQTDGVDEKLTEYLNTATDAAATAITNAMTDASVWSNNNYYAYNVVDSGTSDDAVAISTKYSTGDTATSDTILQGVVDGVVGTTDAATMAASVTIGKDTTTDDAKVAAVGASPTKTVNISSLQKAKLADAAKTAAANLTLPGGTEYVYSGNKVGEATSQDMTYTANGEVGLTVTAANEGLGGQISGLSLSITDSQGNVKKSANASLDAFSTTIFAANESSDNALKFHVGATANLSITVGLADMRSEALGLKGSDGSKVSVATQAKANAAVATFDNALQKALDIQTTIGAVEARLDYTSSNLTTSSENVQAAESTIRDADMAKEMTSYTKNNVLLQAAQSMLAQANQNSSAVLSLLQ